MFGKSKLEKRVEELEDVHERLFSFIHGWKSYRDGKRYPNGLIHGLEKLTNVVDKNQGILGEVTDYVYSKEKK